LFGCDICQDVCPHNGRAQPTAVEDFREIRIGDRRLSLRSLLAIETDEAFLQQFAGLPLMRAKRRGLQRNACVVAGNSGDASLIPDLQGLIDRESDEMLQEHATWAIAQLQ
jgi:epoxyqueuosine reductase